MPLELEIMFLILMPLELEFMFLILMPLELEFMFLIYHILKTWDIKNINSSSKDKGYQEHKLKL
jgi:hypothetical protein